MIFSSRVNRPKRIATPPGTATVSEFQLRIVDGITALVKIGEKPLNEIIQAGYDGSTVADKLDRWRRGDESALGVPGGTYGDFTEFPTTLTEMQSYMQDVSNKFDSLPGEIRQAYGYNLGLFLQAVDNGDFIRRFGKVVEKADEAPAAATAAASSAVLSAAPSAAPATARSEADVLAQIKKVLDV